MYLFIILLCTNFIFSSYGGGYAGSGLRYGSNAREFALSGSLIADKQNGFSSFSNPASIRLSRKNIIGMSIQNLSLDRSIQSFNYSKKLPPSAAVGIAFLRSGTTNIDLTDELNKKIGTLQSSETAGMISFSIGFTSKLSIGINIKALFSQIYDDYTGTGISGDFGLMYKLNRNLYFGAMINNINASYNWKNSNDSSPYQEYFPKLYIIGLSHYSKQSSLFYQHDIVTINNNNVNYRIRSGIEFKLKNKMKLRFGFKQVLGTSSIIKDNVSNNLKSSFGIGVPIQVWHKQYISFDYALDPGKHAEGLSHLFSFLIKY